jgi:hypothetical protein
MAISSANLRASSATSPSPTSPNNVLLPVDMFKRGIQHNILQSIPKLPASMFTLALAKDAFIYVLEKIIGDESVTMAGLIISFILSS